MRIFQQIPRALSYATGRSGFVEHGGSKKDTAQRLQQSQNQYREYGNTALFESHLNPFYNIKITPKLKATFSQADYLKNQIKEYRSQTNGNLEQALQNKLRYLWTYHSNAIEGNRLTLGDTIFFLQEGLTVSGKPLRDFLDAQNHSEAIDYLLEIVKGDAPINPQLLKSLNALLLKGIDFIPGIDALGQKVQKPVHPGTYKSEPNYALQSDGSIHEYVIPFDVPHQIEDLCEWIQSNIEKEHPIITASVAHYNHVRIHPFQDGNGRGARLLMNLILMRHHYHPAIINVTTRQDYLQFLKEADNGNLTPFIQYIAQTIIETQQTVLEEIEKYLQENHRSPTPRC